jgi:AmmeMemoRadiSam system protein B/AmmeMemoRadiSam system protein A
MAHGRCDGSWIAVAILAAGLSVAVAAEPATTDLRSSLAGTWYPGDADGLRSQIKTCFDKAATEQRPDLIALIEPHAGYPYSGPTAAKGMALIARAYSRIIVIGPTHHVALRDGLIVPRARSFQTPLGKIPIDEAIVDRLLHQPLFKDMPAAFEGENSVEIELPLLQFHQAQYGEFKLVPILAGQCSAETVSKAAAILRTCVDPNTLVVASSDFTHYGPNYDYVPFKDNVSQGLKDLDMGAFAPIAAKDAKGFLDYQKRTGDTICGYIPIAILLSMLDPSTKVQLVDYTTSGKVTSDYTNSVSYFSVAFTGTWPGGPAVGQPAQPPAQASLSETDKRQLLTLARKTLSAYLQNSKSPSAADLGVQVSSAMKVNRAAFVTLKKQGALRGCIGDVLPRQPLYQSVIENAINAAVNDPRFMPVSQSEVKGLTIEISALTVPQPVQSADQIRLGTDGIILSKAGRRALFLPQVAPEQGWTIQQTLTELSRKAGLPPDAWREGASFQVFQAEVFGEQ